LVQCDAKIGIQRVLRSILKEWLLNPPEGYRVEPVYAAVEQGYRYARQFIQRFLGVDNGVLADEPIDFAMGDIFFGMDLQPQVQVAQRAFYQTMRRQGVRVRFMVYDLLCVMMPQYFPPGAADGFAQWLNIVAESDGAVCISRAVADELAVWVEQSGAKRQRPFAIDWFHLGVDVEHTHPTECLPLDADTALAQFRSRITFLMVGTLEPRKGHSQVLDALEQLWQSGIDTNLVIVGKQGWMVKKMVDRLRAHAEREKRLFWLEGISDEYLEKIYAASTCLIAASYGEGFGLPLIEAAQHKLPIITRDIPVFREVAGEYAYYFESETADGLAEAIKSWLSRYGEGIHLKSADMPWLTWKESAARLLKILINRNSKR
jgi:glycosyltransferase involved in cell wall biosynthesis